MLGLLPHLRRSRRCPRRHWTERAQRWSDDAHCRSQTVERSETAWPAPCDGRRDRSAPDDAPRFAADRLREEMTMRLTMLALVASITTTAHAQGLVPYYGPDGQVYYRGAPDPGYAPPGVPPDIIAPERPRGAPRPRNVAPPIAVCRNITSGNASCGSI